MPYIKQQRRKNLWIEGIVGIPENAGELNFLITSVILEYLEEKEKISYADYNEVIGVLECCKLEIYRKLISKYEDKKCKENGEVFE